MQTILDYTKEIVDEIYKHDDHWDYTIVIEPNAVQLMEKDLYIPYSIMRSKDKSFLVTNYHEFGITDTTFKTVKEAVDYIFS